jgi:glycosyltransferase involved in cell wall biosynthesis
MKRQKISRKRLIEKKIELRNQKLLFLDKRGNKAMDDLDEIRNRKRADVYLQDKQNTYIDVSRLNNSERTALRAENGASGFRIYEKKAFVDYDVVICIPSHNRYEKVRRLIQQFHEQPTKYTIKIILLNDGSTDTRYGSLINEFSNLTYIENKTPNGKVLHWYCYNQMWEFLKNITCHVVLQMDDDFILSKGFLDAVVDMFFSKKAENGRIMAIAPHLWSFKKITEHEQWWQRKDFVDGIALIDDAVIKHMEYKMKPVDAVAVSKPGTPVRAWNQINDAIKEMSCWIFRTQYSMVYHDGNDDSQLHADSRRGGGVYTQKYIEKL